MTELKYPKRWPFVLAGIFMFFCAFTWLLRCLEPINALIEYGPECMELGTLISIFAYLIFFFVFGIVLMTAKNSVGTIVLLGIYTAQEVYWLVDTLKYYFEYSLDIYSLLSLAIDVFIVIALVFLFLIALCSRINQKNGFVNAWFVPFLFGLLSMVAAFADYIVLLLDYLVFEEIIYFILIFIFVNLHTLAILFYGIGLKIAMNKKPAVKVVPGVNMNQVNTNFRPAREQKMAQGLNFAPIEDPLQVPKQSPIMPPATETQQTKGPSDEAMEEMKKYKQLLDAGIITEEEFNRKKQQMLGL